MGEVFVVGSPAADDALIHGILAEVPVQRVQAWIAEELGPPRRRSLTLSLVCTPDEDHFRQLATFMGSPSPERYAALYGHRFGALLLLGPVTRADFIVHVSHELTHAICHMGYWTRSMPWAAEGYAHTVARRVASAGDILFYRQSDRDYLALCRRGGQLPMERVLTVTERDYQSLDWIGCFSVNMVGTLLTRFLLQEGGSASRTRALWRRALIGGNGRRFAPKLAAATGLGLPDIEARLLHILEEDVERPRGARARAPATEERTVLRK